MLFEPWKDGAEFRVAVVGDVDELRGHTGIDVHLRMTHVSDQFHAHRLHLVVHEVARTVARVSGQDHLGAGFGFDGVHHFEGLHFEAFRHLKGNQTVVVGANALHQLIQFEVVAVKVHVSPHLNGVASPS